MANAPESAKFEKRFLGRYRLLREIGRGGTGTVYEAIATLGGAKVAVKVLRDSLQANGVAKERLQREVEAASRVDHPAVIKIHGWGEEAGATYIAMEYVDGQPLSKLLSPIAAFPLETTVRIVHQVASGLARVHAAGLVHRDVKPDNLIVLKNMAVKLSDFGVAKLPNSSLTVAGELWGTLHYMSPEQVQGKLEIDSRSDIFSLGVVLFEMLTCKRPFDGIGVGMSLVKRIIESPAPAATKLKPGIPEAFDAIVQRSLAKNPAERYQTCDDFARDLRAAMPALRLG